MLLKSRQQDVDNVHLRNVLQAASFQPRMPQGVQLVNDNRRHVKVEDDCPASCP